MMPLFAFRLMAFLGDVYVVTFPESLRDGYGRVQQELWTHSRFASTKGLEGERPEFCDARTCRSIKSQIQKSSSVDRFGDANHRSRHTSAGDPTVSRGLRGSPLACSLSSTNFFQTREGPDMQSAWVLLLHCASARANHLLRVVRPDFV